MRHLDPPVMSASITIVALPSSVRNANSPSLKRTFIAVTTSTPPSPDRPAGSIAAAGVQARESKQRIDRPTVHAPASKRRGPPPLTEMPAAAGPRLYENHLPSFMSVYDMDSSLVEHPRLGPPTIASGSSCGSQQLQRPPSLQQQQPLQESKSEDTDTQIHSHQHRESTSTQASDSTDSSPTTTISTVDSASLSDPSPSSSPESPVTLVPLSSFTGSTFGLDSFQSLKMADSNTNHLQINDDRPMTSPSPRKAKNPKSLALNLSPAMDAFQSSEPSSPSFIKPPTLKGRRKPSLLSLNTGAANAGLLSLEPVPSSGIPTLSQRRGLKHSASSPQILSTPGFGPSGGMTFGERNTPRLFGTSRLKDANLAMNTFTISEDADHESPAGVQMATRVPGITVGGDSFDRPHSGEDAKSPSYPEGPILMHEPSVHLYLEPKLEEAMKFDVIINVAKEVKNPFKAMLEDREAKQTPTQITSDPTDPNKDPHIITPATAASIMSFRTAFEVQPIGSTESSPTTPKPSVETQLPEYIHVPWDHNTDVKDELWDLCQTIEARTREGKRVLVHCQQGASRSATLIIAYGMYINQDLGPNEAYSLAQAKSRWVNPNMSLLFSLNDFKKVIEKKKAESINNIRKTQAKHRTTQSAETLDPPPTPSRARGNSTPSATARDSSLNKGEDVSESSRVPNLLPRSSFDFGFGGTYPRVDVQQHHDTDWKTGLMSPRLTEMTDNPIQRALSRSFGSDSDSPPTPGLFSPRTFEFPRSSFFPPPSMLRHSLPAEEDPRSPPTKGEVPITRSIDDFL